MASEIAWFCDFLLRYGSVKYLSKNVKCFYLLAILGVNHAMSSSLWNSLIWFNFCKRNTNQFLRSLLSSKLIFFLKIHGNFFQSVQVLFFGWLEYFWYFYFCIVCLPFCNGSKIVKLDTHPKITFLIRYFLQFHNGQFR